MRMRMMMAVGIRRKKEERVGMWKIVFDGGCDDAKNIQKK